jgi:hypothetical protein
MKTAVEWLEEQLYKTDWNTLNHDEKMNICSTAKLMEMDQIKNAYHEGLTDVIAMEYFNNTFKNDL